MIIIFIMNFLFAISTTIGMTIIPWLVTEKLGLSLFTLGMIEGGTELLSNVLRLASGNLFDRMKNRRLLFVFPAALAFVSKLVLYVPTPLTVLTSKIMERIANGAFSVPRDAYVGENTTNKGFALGILSASKSSGCILGPLLVSGMVLLLGSLQENMQGVIVFACLLNFIAFFLSFFVAPKKEVTLAQNQGSFNLTEFKQSFKHLRLLFAISFLFFLGRFNDGVIMLYLKKQGFPEWFYLSTIALFNLVMLVVSPIIGICMDKKNAGTALLLISAALFFFNILFYNVALAPWAFTCLGLMCWGIQRAGAQIAFPAIILRKIPAKYYGTAIGAYYLLSGIGIFIASIISGHLAQISFSYIFLLSGIFSLCAFGLTLYTIRSIQLAKE